MGRDNTIKRREFLRWLAVLFTFMVSGCLKEKQTTVREVMSLEKEIKSNVYVIRTTDRGSGVKELLRHFDLSGLKGKRVALDAAGVAVLRIYGTTDEVSKGSVFEQEQLARAIELGLGASKPDEIEVIAVNDEAQEICARIKEKLKK